MLGHAGTAQSRVGAPRAEQVLGASTSHSCLSQKPPQQHRLLQGCCAHSNPVWEGRASVLEISAPCPLVWGWSWELLGLSSAPNVQLWLPGHRGHGWMAGGG